MRIPTLDSQLSLFTVRKEVRYTLLRLRHLPWAKAWATTFAGLLKETDAAIATEGQLTDALEDAEANIDAADDDLDTLVYKTSNMAKTHLQGEGLLSLNRELFGNQIPSRFVRTRLGPQLEAMRTWPAVLEAVAAQELKDLAAPVTAALKQADRAQNALHAADGALSAFRASIRQPMIQKIDAQRQALGGEAERAAREPAGDGAELSLFRSSDRQRRRAAPAQTLERARAEVKSCEADLEEARQRLRAVEERLQASEEAAAARLANQKRIEELLKQKSAADAEIAALREAMKQ